MQVTGIGQWLKEMIARKGTTMRQVAQYTGISVSTISNTVRGIYIPNPANCVRLAEYFKVDPDYVLQLAGHRPQRYREEELPDFHIYVSRKFRNNPRLQRALVAAYEALTEAREEEERRIREKEKS